MNKTAFYFHVLNSLPHIGSKSILRIYCYAQTLSDFMKSPGVILRKANVSDSYIGEILSCLSPINVDVEQDLLNSHSVSIISCFDEHYPSLLLEANDYPALLYYHGIIPDDSALSLAVVGSRRCSKYGKKVTKHIVSGLSPYKPVIISGLAFGIDAAAHEASVSCGVPTVAVLGSGVCNVHPQSNRGLAQEIIDSGGAVVSEFPPFEQARPEYFPRRNRIVAGLSKGVVVVEAAKKSGALITAELALSYNRDVFAVPGSIFSTVSIGSHALLQDGARLLTSVSDIAEEYDLKLSDTSITNEDDASLEGRIVLFVSSNSCAGISDISSGLDISYDEVVQAVTMLEISGVLTQDSQGYFSTE